MKKGNFSEIIGFEEMTSINNADSITSREFYNQIHSVVDRPAGHSANKIYINEFDEIFAIRCNCTKIHPVFKNGQYSADWQDAVQKKLIVKFKKMNHNTFLNCIQL